MTEKEKEINNEEAFKELFYQEEDAKDKVEESVKTIFSYFDSIKAENNKLKEILNILKKTKNLQVYFFDNGKRHYVLKFDRTRNQRISKEQYELIKGWLENDK